MAERNNSRGNSPTPYQRQFLRRHLTERHLEDGMLPRYFGQATWPLVDRCQIAGWVEIVENDEKGSKFPWSWKGTKLTEAGKTVICG